MTAIRARTRFNELHEDGQRPIGAFVMSTDSATTAIYGAAGYDWVLIDREHGVMDNADMRAHLLAAQAHGLVSIVRVLENNAAMIQQSLDAGAQSILVPKVGSAEEARRAVAATRYTSGGRGMCPVVPPTGFTGGNWAQYSDEMNENVLLIPLIETRAGVENIAEICAVEGVDYVFFGLADLSQDLGLEMIADGARLVELWTHVATVAHNNGVRVGAPLGYGFEDLADFGSLDADLSTLRTAADNALRSYKAQVTPLPR